MKFPKGGGHKKGWQPLAYMEGDLPAGLYVRTWVSFMTASGNCVHTMEGDMGLWLQQSEILLFSPSGTELVPRRFLGEKS